MTLELDYVNEFLYTKAWALLHDPPNKAWIKGEHEKLAKKIALEIFKGTAFGGGVPGGRVYDAVKRADRAASTFDRWLLLKTWRGKWLDYHNILNIFDPSVKAYRNDISQAPNDQEIQKFVENLKNIIRSVYNDPLLIYHLLYGVLEYTWGTATERVSPADTRFPVQSVFDHNYATASMVNWYLTGKEPQGFLLYFDIPGIQPFISRSRKALDYWAGSYLISYLTFKTFEEFIKFLGPDILLMPTTRHNPTYKQWLLLNVIERVHNNATELAIKLVNTWGELYLEEIHPVIPGTLSIALPKFDDNLTLSLKSYSQGFRETDEPKLRAIIEKCRETDNLREFIYRQYERVWKDLVEDIKDLKYTKTSVGTRLIASILPKYAEFFEHPPITPRVIIIDIGEAYKKYVLKALEDFTILEELIDPEAIEKLNNVINDIANKLKIDRRDLLEKLFYHLIFTTILHDKIKYTKLKEKGFPISPRLLKATENYTEFVKKYEKVPLSVARMDKSSWRYCTICGSNPAIIRFPLNRKEYENIVREVISLSQGELDELLIRFKPGESLCPVCIVKRTFRDIIASKIPDKIAEALKVPEIESVDEISNRCLALWFKERKQDLNELIKRLKKEQKDVLYEFIKKVEKNRYSYDRVLNNLRANGYSDMEIADLKYSLDVALRNLLRMDEVRKLIDDPTLRTTKFRDYYTIIRGDGDNMGKVVRGILGVKPEEYIEAVLKNISNFLDDEIKKFYEELKNSILRIMNALRKDDKCKDLSIIISPSYHSSISASLMATSIKDIRAIKRNKGLVIYSGGDDIIALAPTEKALDIIIDTRKNYWAFGEDKGFHKFMRGGLIIPALVAYGRSYGVRYAHIMDPMQSEIRITSTLLDTAKDSLWTSLKDNSRIRKDSIAISYGRVSTERSILYARLPLYIAKEEPGALLKFSKNIWYNMLNGVISMNLPSDYLDNENTISLIVMSRRFEDAESVLRYILERNIAIPEKENITRSLIREMSTMKIYEYYNVSMKEKLSKEDLLVNNMFYLIQILRNIPR